MKSNGLNRIFAIRGIVEKGLDYLFGTSNSLNFFNKTDFERYLFKILVLITTM